MSQFSVVVTKYGQIPNARCFEDFAFALRDALRELGHDAVFGPRAAGRLIMFGANNMSDFIGAMPRDAICFNSEQVSAVEAPNQYINVSLYRDRVVWDYSEANVETLRELGAKRVVYCPVGYVKSMTKIEVVKDEDIDVLFYGSMNVNRRKILAGLASAKLNVVRLYNVYGPERDAIIARSKVVLNMHYYERGVFEIFRASHLLANRKCVVSENGGRDSGLEEFASRATRHVPYDGLVEACRELVADAAERRRVAERGFEEFSKTSLAESVRKALESSS